MILNKKHLKLVEQAKKEAERIKEEYENNIEELKKNSEEILNAYLDARWASC